MEKAFVVSYTEYTEYTEEDDTTVDVIGVYSTEEAAQIGISQLYAERGRKGAQRYKNGWKGAQRYNNGREVDGEVYTMTGTVSVLQVPVNQYSKYGW